MFPWLVRLCFCCCAMHVLALHMYVCVCVCVCVYMWVCGFTLTCAWGTQHNDWATGRSCSHLSLQLSIKHLPLPAPSTSEARLAVCLFCMSACFVCVLKAVALIEAHRAIRALHPVSAEIYDPSPLMTELHFLLFKTFRFNVLLSRTDTVKTLLCETF